MMMMMMMIIVITINSIQTVRKQLMVANHGKNMTEEVMINIEMKNKIMKIGIDGIENMMKKQK